jgi:hypothetical protein
MAWWCLARVFHCFDLHNNSTCAAEPVGDAIQFPPGLWIGTKSSATRNMGTPSRQRSLVTPACSIDFPNVYAVDWEPHALDTKRASIHAFSSGPDGGSWRAVRSKSVRTHHRARSSLPPLSGWASWEQHLRRSNDWLFHSTQLQRIYSSLSGWLGGTIKKVDGQKVFWSIVHPSIN